MLTLPLESLDDIDYQAEYVASVADISEGMSVLRFIPDTLDDSVTVIRARMESAHHLYLD